LVALTACAVLRRLGLSSFSALVASLLYTFLPFHFNRLGIHPYLFASYLVPPLLLVGFWLYLDDNFLFGRASERRNTRFRFRSGRALASLAIGVLVGCAGIYYAFFPCYLLLAAGVAAAIRRRCFQPLLAAGVVISVICAGILANLVPNLVYFRE